MFLLPEIDVVLPEIVHQVFDTLGKEETTVYCLVMGKACEATELVNLGVQVVTSIISCDYLGIYRLYPRYLGIDSCIYPSGSHGNGQCFYHCVSVFFSSHKLPCKQLSITIIYPWNFPLEKSQNIYVGCSPHSQGFFPHPHPHHSASIHLTACSQIPPAPQAAMVAL